MNKKLNQVLKVRLTMLPLLLLAAMNVHAQAAKPCIELKNEAQLRQEYTDAQGKKAVRLVAPSKVVPGNEIVYTLTARNVCDKPATNVAVNNPVPEHMTYVPNSAAGTGAEIVYSLDNKSFAKLETLTVKNADGSTRAARADDIKGIRWTIGAINPGQSSAVNFHATVK
jgi:uncharacterized repeat protein (TIGR01451 family)